MSAGVIQDPTGTFPVTQLSIASSLGTVCEFHAWTYSSQLATLEYQLEVLSVIHSSRSVSPLAVSNFEVPVEISKSDACCNSMELLFL